MYCPQCGKQIPDTSNVCGYCGSKIIRLSPPPAPPGENKTVTPPPTTPEITTAREKESKDIQRETEPATTHEPADKKTVPVAPPSPAPEETPEPEAAYAAQTPPAEPTPEPVRQTPPPPQLQKPKKPVQIPWQWVGPAGGGVLIIAFFVLVYFGLLPFSGLQHSLKLLTPDPEAGQLLASAACNSRFTNDPKISSSWSENRVRIDGKPTLNEEWADATCTQGYLYHLAWQGENLVETGTTSVRWWVKNDAKWVYMLVRINKDDMRLINGVYLDYFWDGGGDWDWQGTDGIAVTKNGDVSDMHGWDGQEWYPDEEAGGKINSRGSFSEDETYFWFEFKKELNSGEDLDWRWLPGSTYGSLAHSGYDSLLLGAWESVPTDMKQLSFSLTIAEE